MLSRPIALLCALAMLASLFLPWFSLPLGETLVPWDAVQDLNADSARNLLENAPPEVLVFVASFAMAAIFLLLSLVRLESRITAFVTGALPVGLIAWTLFAARDQATRAGFPLPSADDIPELASRATELLGSGAWAWIGGAVCLLALGLFDPGRRRA